MSKIFRNLGPKGVRFIFYFAVAALITHLIASLQVAARNQYQQETAYVIQQRIYLLALDKLNPDIPEFNALRAGLLQRIYDLRQKPSIGSVNLNPVMDKIYELDSIFDRLYFYDPVRDLSGVEQSVQAARARAAIDGLSEIEQKLAQQLSDSEVGQFKIQLAKVTTTLAAILNTGNDSTEQIHALRQEYDILIDVAWDTELTPLASEQGKQRFSEIAAWLSAR